MTDLVPAPFGQPESLSEASLLRFAEKMLALNPREFILSARDIGAHEYLCKDLRDLKSERVCLEAEIAQALSINQSYRSVTALNKGTSALRLALKLEKITHPEKKEVLVPEILVRSTIDAILLEGLIPVVVPSTKTTLHMDLDRAEAFLTLNTIAILTVDIFGIPIPSIEQARSLKAKYEIAWISDSAQSFFAGEPLAHPVQFADYTIFSTGYPKVFHTLGLGGILVSPRQGLNILEATEDRALLHFLMPELNAAFGRLMLPEVLKKISARRSILAEINIVAKDFNIRAITGLGTSNNAYQASFEVPGALASVLSEEIERASNRIGLNRPLSRVLYLPVSKFEVSRSPDERPLMRILTIPLHSDMVIAHVNLIKDGLFMSVFQQ